jgi:hypothetical protein
MLIFIPYIYSSQWFSVRLLEKILEIFEGYNDWSHAGI